MADPTHLQPLAVALAARHPAALDPTKAAQVAADAAAAAVAIGAALPTAIAQAWKTMQTEAREARVAAIVAAHAGDAVTIESQPDGGVIVRFEPPPPAPLDEPKHFPEPDAADMQAAQAFGDDLRRKAQEQKQSPPTEKDPSP